MKSGFLLIAVASALLAQTPEFDAGGKLVRPNYREWIFLSSGLGMNYSAEVRPDGAFDNVFVVPSAYHEFLKTGHWPEKTIFVLEVRKAQSRGSINQAGHFQTEIVAIEAEIKDSAKYPDKWAFFSFDDHGQPGATAHMIPHGSVCQTCHGKNALVENTFVQFYPTLIDVARKFGTAKATAESH